MSADKTTIPVVSGSEEYADVKGSAQEDKAAAESEASGKIPSSEVDALKDSLGGGEVLDGAEQGGVTTRGAEVDAYKQEKEVDQLDLGEEESK